MTAYLRLILLIIAAMFSCVIKGQDTERPLPPVLDLVSVQPSTGNVLLEWSPGGSPDVAGYVIYRFQNQEGYAIDTLLIPQARSYINMDANANFFTESYVVAAIDSSDNISPLSNSLNTIYTEAKLDTCSHEIEVIWNRYLSDDPEVTEYIVYIKQQGGEYQPGGNTDKADTIFSLESFESYTEYCFYVEAVLSDGESSLSNSFCIGTSVPIPPDWINADYASINNEGFTELSFTIDPESEYTRYQIERSTDSLDNFEIIFDIQTEENRIQYTDNTIPGGTVYYRMAAVNSCGEKVIISNPASTMEVDLKINNNYLEVNWNNYYGWRGGISEYRIFRNNTGGFQEIYSSSGSDTSYSDYINDFMFQTNKEDICYKIIAYEGTNPYFNNAQSTSETVCIKQPFRLFMPNAFTPDDNLVNDEFLPSLSFTPAEYKMIIKTRSGQTVFSTNDHLEGWDGRHAGTKLPEDVYIWFIELKTPGGNKISKSGTVAIIFNFKA